MIKLNKLPEPRVLQDNKTRWTQEYKDAKAAKVSDLSFYKYRYRDPQVKSQIVSETSEKCAYCESKIRHISPGDIEHIKPVAEFDDEIFKWENLTLSCQECNRRKLDNYDSEVGILNPYQTDPHDHLVAAGPMILPKIGDTAGKIAYEIFQLNRFSLLERRLDKVEALRLLLENYANETNTTLRKLYRRRIEAEKDGSKEFAMVARAYITSCLKSDGHLRSYECIVPLPFESRVPATNKFFLI